jgi:hypothetical protein
MPEGRTLHAYSLFTNNPQLGKVSRDCPLLAGDKIGLVLTCSYDIAFLKPGDSIHRGANGDRAQTEVQYRREHPPRFRGTPPIKEGMEKKRRDIYERD